MRIRTMKGLGAALAAALASVALAACGSGGEALHDRDSSGTEVKAGKPIKIGVLLPLSGEYAVNGDATKVGEQLAADIVNGSFDLNLPGARDKGLPGFGGSPIRLVFSDHQSNPANGVVDVQRLVTQDQVAAILGAWNSGVTQTASQTAERLGVPFLTAVSSDPKLTQQGYKWFFSITPTDATFSKNYFEFLKALHERYGTAVQRVAQINSTEQRGAQVAKLQRTDARAMGFDMVGDVSYSASSSNLTAEVQRLKSSDPDVLLASLASDADCEKLLQASRNLAFHPTSVFVIGNACTVPGFLESAGPIAGATVAREVFSTDIADRKPIVGEVNDMYRKRSGGKDMTAEAARGFMGVLTLADAINRAGSTAPDKIREALLKTDIPADQVIMSWNGIKFDPKAQNNPLASGIIVQSISGEWRTIWPFNVAPEKPVVPFPQWRSR